ncbi:hypothetical protein HCH54_001572 [Aspergillus fumigatus]
MRLSEYLQRHVFDVVSVKDATFHLDQREDLRARKVKAWVRTDQGLEEEKNPVFQDPCYWWIDINKGVAGIYLSQLLPTGDQTAIELLTEFERWVYSRLDEVDGLAK